MVGGRGPVGDLVLSKAQCVDCCTLSVKSGVELKAVAVCICERPTVGCFKDAVLNQ